MDLKDLERGAAQLGWATRPYEDGVRVRVEIPEGSDNFLIAKLTRDGRSVALVAGVEMTDEQKRLFSSASPRRRTQGLDDITSYMCTFDIEYDFDIVDNIPRVLYLAARWEAESGIDGLISCARMVLRAKQGTMHRLRFWIGELESSAGEVERRHGDGVAPRGSAP